MMSMYQARIGMPHKLNSRNSSLIVNSCQFLNHDSNSGASSATAAATVGSSVDRLESVSCLI